MIIPHRAVAKLINTSLENIIHYLKEMNKSIHRQMNHRDRRRQYLLELKKDLAVVAVVPMWMATILLTANQ